MTKVYYGGAWIDPSGPASGSAGGVLAGTYPDPSFASDMATQAELDAEAAARTAADSAAAGLTLDAVADYGMDPDGGNAAANDTAIALAVADMIAGKIGTLYFRDGGTFDFSASILVPLETITGGKGKIVFNGNARLRWTADLGADVSCLRPTGYDQQLLFEAHGLTFVGPDGDGTAFHWGTGADVDMDGPTVNSRAAYRNCVSRGFKAGFVIRGDHNILDNVRTPRCFYGLHFKAPDNNGFQAYDHTLIGSEFAQCWWASIAVAADATIGQLESTGLVQVCNGAPIGIYFEKGTRGGISAETGGRGIHNSLLHAKWEGAGIAFVYDANYADGDTANYRTIDKCSLHVSFHNLRNTNGVACFGATNPYDGHVLPSAWEYGVVMGEFLRSRVYHLSVVDRSGKVAAKLLATTNVNIASAPATIDGVTPSATWRILLIGQTAPAENGVYIWQSVGAAMARSSDLDTSAEMVSRVYLAVTQGTHAGEQYTLTTVDPIVLGTTALTWTLSAPTGAENLWDVGHVEGCEFHGPNYTARVAGDLTPGAPVFLSTTPLDTANRHNNMTETVLFNGSRRAVLYVSNGTVSTGDALRINNAAGARVSIYTTTGVPRFAGIAAHDAVAGQYLWTWVDGRMTVGSATGWAVGDLLTVEASPNSHKFRLAAAGEPIYGLGTTAASAGGTGTMLLNPGIGMGNAVARTVATDTIWDAAGDLAVGTGADTAARLAKGTALQVLRVNSGATALEWSAPSASGSMATDAIWDTLLDLVVGTGANTAARLAGGSALQYLRVNSGATALEWATFAANLTAFANLTLIADRLPYADGTGTLALATFTAAGRALLDDADADAMLATLGAVDRENGGLETVQAHGSTGATETIDLANGNWHTVAQDQACTYTFTGATSGKACSFTLEMSSVTGAATWPASVDWPDATAPTLSGKTIITFATTDGGTTWLGFPGGKAFA